MTVWSLSLIFLVALITTLGLGLMIRSIATQKSWGLDDRHRVPRVGGLAIILTCIGFSIWLYSDNSIFIKIICCALIVAAIGLFDDLGLGKGPIWKLSISLAAAALAIGSSDVYIININTPILSELMEYVPFAVAISLIGIAGMSHAINLIDGVHGLALSVSLVIFMSLGVICFALGSSDHTKIAVSVAGACAGLLTINFPNGSIFVGDVGSYFLGFLAAWLSISICFHYPHVSPWAMFCIFVYPIVDVGCSVARRLLLRKNPFTGDQDHFHHRLLKVLPAYFYLCPRKLVVTTTLSCTLLATCPAILATYFYLDPQILIILAIVSTIFLSTINWIVAKLIGLNIITKIDL